MIEAYKRNKGFYANVALVVLNVAASAELTGEILVGVCWGTAVTLLIYLNVSVAGITNGIGQGISAMINTMINIEKGKNETGRKC
jgi:UPF0716 family protein affecting phage T7 exclusion